MVLERPTTKRWLRSAQVWSGAVGTSFLAVGIWMYVAPRSFFDTAGTFEPYNSHYVRDAASLQIGVGVAGLVGALRVRATVVGLAALTAFQVLHVGSHVIDRNNGGRPGLDIPFLSLVALGTAVALVWLLRAPPAESPPADRSTE